MATLHPLHPHSGSGPGEPLALHDRAMDNLRFIRETMERAGSFTAVSGWSEVAIGATALLASWVASLQGSAAGWLTVWCVEAVVALAVGGWGVMRKARSVGMPLRSGPGRKVALCLFPPLAAGAVLTAVLFRVGLVAPLPGLWLLLFGAGTVAAGSYSVRIVPVMGLCFMAVGGAALLTPTAWADAMMALGFGGVHILFGLLIARRHGG
ncbi:MAG TPA: hypothetical protein VFI96_05245 [Longimicrobiaceae bacterium]|nr:hypothetical protein [Longimicrobiaceae bacterium]